MSKIQELIDAWNTAVDVEIANAQSEVDAYLAARQTAIALTDPFTLKMPKMDVLGITDKFTIDGFDVTTLGQLFDWSYPASGPKNYSIQYNNYRSNPEIVEDYVDRKYDRDDNLITPTSLYTEGYTYATMSYLAEQYETGLKTHQDLYNILRTKDGSFESLKSYKQLKNLGGKAWFDFWMHSLYRVIYNTKISVSNLKYKDYSSIFMRIEDELTDDYLKGYYHTGTRLPLGTAEQSKYFLAVLEAGDGFFPSQTSGTQSGTQSGTNTDYILSVINPLSDIEKKVQGKIVFIESGNYIIPNSTLNGLPNPWTNPKTKVVVPNNSGTITFNGGKSTSTKNNLATDAILALQNIIEGTYGLSIYLKYTEPDGPPVVPPSDLPVGSSASTVTGASESSIPGPTASTIGTQEFTFNVEQLDIFSNADFGNLFIIGQEDETLLYDDGVDVYGSEYVEDEFAGQDEFALEQMEELAEVQMDMAEARLNDTSDSVSGNNGAGNFEASAKLKPSKLTKSMTFTQVTEAVISNLEGGYFHPDMTKDGRVKDSRYSTSGETMFGLDRKQGDSTSTAAKNFWSAIDSSGARSKWRWNHMPKEPLYSQLVKLAAGVMEPKFNSSLNNYCPDKNIQALIKSDGRLMFNVIYAQWNGVGWIKGLLKVINEEYNSGKKDSESLLKSSVIERVNGGHRMYKLGTGKSLGSRSASLIAQGGKKIAKLTGVQVA